LVSCITAIPTNLYFSTHASHITKHPKQY
jgi:hypothetical protein